MANIEIICPLYKGEHYLDGLVKGIYSQKTNDNVILNFILTDTGDTTEDKLKELGVKYKKIKKEEFSHSLTREQAAFESKADIIVFISQDIEIANENWLDNLVKDIRDNKVAAAFSRQITKYDNIEKYTREKNYPSESRIVSEKDINKLGLNTFFFSDSSSAINRDIFVKLNGYDSKDLPTNEDMYFAEKLIANSYKIEYASDSIVYHSHKYTLKQLYDRYYLYGKFLKQNKQFDKYSTTKVGGGLAKYIILRAIQEKNVKVILTYLPDMASRYIGMKVGSKT